MLDFLTRISLFFMADGIPATASDFTGSYNMEDDDDTDGAGEEEPTEDQPGGDEGSDDAGLNDSGSGEDESADGDADQSEDGKNFDERGFDEEGFNKEGFHRSLMQLPDRYKNHPQFKGLKSLGEVVDKLMARVETDGAPETVEEYNLDKVNLGELGDKGSTDRFLQTLLDNKLSNSQGVAIQQYINQEVRAGLRRVEETRNAAADKVEAHYRQEWGSEYPDNVEYMNAGLDYLGRDKFEKWLGKSGMGSDVDMVFALHRVGRLVKEDPIFGRVRPGRVNKEQRRRSQSALTYPSMDKMMDGPDDDE
jgi:hypothetical protein